MADDELTDVAYRMQNDGAIQPELVKPMNKLARVIQDAIREAGVEGKMGFALFIFGFNGGLLNYISNANRDDMLKTMAEFINRDGVPKAGAHHQRAHAEERAKPCPVCGQEHHGRSPH